MREWRCVRVRGRRGRRRDGRGGGRRRGGGAEARRRGGAGRRREEAGGGGRRRACSFSSAARSSARCFALAWPSLSPSTSFAAMRPTSSNRFSAFACRFDRCSCSTRPRADSGSPAASAILRSCSSSSASSAASSAGARLVSASASNPHPAPPPCRSSALTADRPVVAAIRSARCAARAAEYCASPGRVRTGGGCGTPGALLAPASSGGPSSVTSRDPEPSRTIAPGGSATKARDGQAFLLMVVPCVEPRSMSQTPPESRCWMTACCRETDGCGRCTCAAAGSRPRM